MLRFEKALSPCNELKWEVIKILFYMDAPPLLQESNDDCLINKLVN
jgi:hypothetical protein